jgi:hypothetical protein
MAGLNLVPADAERNAAENAAAFASSVESTLGFADAPTDELRGRLVTAFRYTVSWFDAVKATDSVATWSARISDVMNEITAVIAMIPPGGEFAGKDAVAAYNQTSADFAQLYRDLVASADTLPQPSLLTQLGDLGSAFINAPVAAAKVLAEQAANGVAGLLGNTAAAIWRALWPWLLVAGAVGLVYVFRRPLGRALGKVAS